MNSRVENFLFRNPQFYELAEKNDKRPMMCQRIFSRYLPRPPSSLVEFGSGTARDLNFISKKCPDCWGVDCLPNMVEYAQALRPHLHLVIGDARHVRLGRTFDVILSLDSTFAYALSNQDVKSTLETFALHSHEGTLLILDINNAAGFLGGEYFNPIKERRINLRGFSATVQSRYSFNRCRQQLIRRRTWNVNGRVIAQDFCPYRLFFPSELKYILKDARFQIKGMFDNMQLHESDLTGLRLYVAAIFRPKMAK